MRIREAIVGAALSLAAPSPVFSEESKVQNHPYLGMWITGDGHIRQELLPNGRYDEARGTRGPSSLTTDVESYDVLAPTDASRALLRVPSQG